MNRDILFEIGKELVQSGDSDAVLRFGLSGKEPLNALKRVFANVTTLKLYRYRYAIGWGNSCCTFKFNDNNIPLKFFFNQIGFKVEKLHVHDYVTFARCHNLATIRRIEAANRLVIFSCDDVYVSRSFVDEFLPQFALTLKFVTIPCRHITEIFRDTFNLKSLTLLNCVEKSVVLCCKTSSLTLCGYRSYDILDKITSIQKSPHLSSVETLTIDEFDPVLYNKKLIQHFPTLKCLKYSLKINSPGEIFDIPHVIYGIKHAIKVPAKIICTFYKTKMFSVEYSHLKNFHIGYEYDNSVSDFYVFRQEVQSAGSMSTILEIKIPK